MKTIYNIINELEKSLENEESIIFLENIKAELDLINSSRGLQSSLVNKKSQKLEKISCMSESWSNFKLSLSNFKIIFMKRINE